MHTTVFFKKSKAWCNRNSVILLYIVFRPLTHIDERQILLFHFSPVISDLAINMLRLVCVSDCYTEHGHKSHSEDWQGSWSKGLSVLGYFNHPFDSSAYPQGTAVYDVQEVFEDLNNKFIFFWCQQVVRRLAQNREAARKSRLRKKVKFRASATWKLKFFRSEFPKFLTVNFVNVP
jgi:hypothetical protein